MQGFVKWYSTEKGYGFLRGQDGSDYFVHWRNIKAEGRRYLEADQEVSFEVGHYDHPERGRLTTAIDVELLKNSGEVQGE